MAIVLVIHTEILCRQLMFLQFFSGNKDKKRIKNVVQLQMIQFSGDVSFMIVQTRTVPLHTHQGNQNTDKWLLLSGFKIWKCPPLYLILIFSGVNPFDCETAEGDYNSSNVILYKLWKFAWFFLKVPGLIITGGKYNLDIQSSIEVFSANDTGCSIPRLPIGGLTSF